MGIFTPILFVILLLVLIIPHEWGHMFVARRCGVKVFEFSVGMGPLLYKKKRGETEYSVRLLPLGGFCRIEGEEEEIDSPTSFSSQPAYKKVAILLAGITMNIIIAIVAVALSIAISGVVTNAVGEVKAGFPAEQVLMEGDKLIEIDGYEIDSWNEVSEAVDSYGGDGKTPISVTYERNGERHTVDIVPVYDKESSQYVIGIKGKTTHAFITCVKYIPYGVWYLTKAMLLGFKMIFTGQVGAADIAGPIGLVKYVDQAAGYGPASYLLLIALVSLNLALFNIIPIPGLDGGKLLFIGLNKLSGGKITSEVEFKITAVSMVLIWVLFCGVMINDIMNLLEYW